MIGMEEVVQIARRNFERAQASLDGDLAAAQTPAASKLVRQNRDRALAAYMELLSDTLEGFDGDWVWLAARAKEAAEAFEAGTKRAVGQAESMRLAADLTSSLGDIAKALA